MPALYELAGPPIPYPPGGGPGELLLSDGRFLRWHANTSGRSTISGDIVDANGAPTGITFHLPTPGREHNVAALDDGGFAFVYHDDQVGPNGTHEVYLSIFDSAGTQVVAAFQVNSHVQGVQANAKVAVTAGGQIVVTWTDQSGVVDDGNSAVRARMYNPDGTTLASEFLVPPQPSAPSIARRSSPWKAAVSSSSGCRRRRPATSRSSTRTAPRSAPSGP